MGDQPSDPTSTQPASDAPNTDSPPHHHFHIHLPHHPTTSPTPPGTHHIHLHIPHPFSKPSWSQPPFFRPSSSTQQQPPPPAQSSTHPAPPLLHSTDPTTAPLRAFAEEKSKQHPGEDGSFGNGYTTTMSWGAGSWILPHEGDTSKPPDERRGIHYHYHLEGFPGDWVEAGKEEEKGEEKKD